MTTRRNTTDSFQRGSTKDAIYEAALDAFAEKGYAGASLRDIAQRVGVEVASLYNHIDSKESLLFNIIISTSEELYDVLTSTRDATTSTDPREVLGEVIRAHIRFATTHGRHSFVGNVELRALSKPHYELAIAMRGKVEAVFRDLVAACVDVGQLPPDTPLTVAAYQILALTTTISSWFRPDGGLTADEIADLTIDLLTDRLAIR